MFEPNSETQLAATAAQQRDPEKGWHPKGRPIVAHTSTLKLGLGVVLGGSQNWRPPACPGP